MDLGETGKSGTSNGNIKVGSEALPFGDFALECLGLLANLNLRAIDFSRVLTKLNLLSWLKHRLTSPTGYSGCDVGGAGAGRQVSGEITMAAAAAAAAASTAAEDGLGVSELSPSDIRSMHPSAQDDVLLEAVRLVGTMCQDEAAAQLIASAGIIQDLIILLNGNL
ncbi:unnamed protein product [Protopolystoma xenopodis]|uniref:Uncharacterized protein n=1 Tax=Protopolystoma xenopodis TaxID=117903 RepID=A0A3S5C208_9PLAT|nr:unnamed protein product [Protopolystoma xenopodis]